MKNELDVETARKIRRNKQDYGMFVVYQAVLTASSWGAMFIKDHNIDPSDISSGRVLLTTTMVTALMSVLFGYGALKVDAETREILENLQKGK